MLKLGLRLVSVIALASVFTLVPRVHIAAAAASDKRAPVKVDVSPREVCGVLVVFREHGGFKGDDDQEAQARVAEDLDIASVKAQSHAAGAKGIECGDLSAKPKTRVIAKDDLRSLMRWFTETAIDEDTNGIISPLKDRVQAAIDAK